MSDYKIGDKVKATVTGEILNIYADGDVAVNSADLGFVVFPAKAVEVTEPASEYLPGHAYVDADGDVVIRLHSPTSDGRVWVDADGNLSLEDWVTAPVRPLVMA